MADRLYIQVDAEFGTHPTVAQAGIVGWTVFLYLVATHRKNPADGWVSARRSTPTAIRLGLAAFFEDLEVPDIERALGRIRDAGLIEQDETGATYIHGWDEWFGAATATERSRRLRARINGKRDGKRPNDGSESARNDMQRHATAGNGGQRNATECNDTQRNATDATRPLSSLLVSCTSGQKQQTQNSSVSGSAGSEGEGAGTVPIRHGVKAPANGVIDPELQAEILAQLDELNGQWGGGQ